MRLLSTLAAAALAVPASAQLMGAPPPPEVRWTQNPGAELPLDARFLDHEGAVVTLGECLGDRPTVLALVYYECPMLCGLVLEGMVRGLRGVELTTGADFDVLVLSIDHEETPALAAAKRASALAAFGLDEDEPAARGWRFLVGDEDAVHAVADTVGFEFTWVPETDEWAHAAGVTVLTPDGVVSRVLLGVEFAPRDLRLALVEASAGRIGTVVDQVLLRCFTYDPTRGKYGLAILTTVRLLGMATVAILAFVVVGFLLRERRARRHAAVEGT